MASGVSRSSGSITFQPLAIRREEESPTSVPSLCALALRAVPFPVEIEGYSHPYECLEVYFRREFSEDIASWAFLFDQFPTQDLLYFFYLLDKRLNGQALSLEEEQFTLMCGEPREVEGYEEIIELEALISNPSNCETQRDRLEYAAKFGFEKVVKKLIPYFDHIELEGALQLSNEAKRKTVIPLILERGTNIFGRTPLHWAAVAGNNEKVRELLMNDHDQVDQVDKQGDTALFLAGLAGHGTIMGMLMERGADIEVLKREEEDEWGEKTRILYPLHHLAAVGQLDGIRTLLSNGYEVNDKTQWMDSSPLHWAAAGGQVRAVELLKEKGADLESLNEFNETPLIVAAKNNKPHVIRKLLQLGAKLDVQGTSGTALHCAAEKNAVDAVQCLLEAGISVDIQDLYENKTPLHTATSHNAIEVMLILIEAGADLFAHDRLGDIPLSKALKWGKVKTVHFLLKQEGMGIDLSSSDDSTLLHVAAKGDMPKMIKELVRLGLSVNAQNNEKRTPLHEAVLESHSPVFGRKRVAALIQEGADPYIKDNTGATPLEAFAKVWIEKGIEQTKTSEGRSTALETFQILKQKQIFDALCFPNQFTIHEAVKHGPAAIRLSLAIGEGVSKLDAAGHTPLYYALISGNFEVARELIRGGALRDTLTVLKKSILPLAAAVLFAGFIIRKVWSWKVSLQDSGTSLSSLFSRSVGGR